MKPILEIKNLCIQFTNGDALVKAAEKISFELYKEETLAIIGESGSGKSITALSIIGLLPLSAKIENGEIIFNDAESVNLLSINEKQKRRYRGKKVSMIFQEPMTALNPVFKCGSQIAEAIQLHLKLNKSEARKYTLKLFEDVKLTNVERIYNSYPHSLSGGEKQRVLIAMALSCNPSVLIADEPTTSVDVIAQAAILDLIRSLIKERGMSMIIISHDLAVVSKIADRIVVMHKGNIVEQGSVDEIFGSPKHPYTKGLLACRPSLNMRLKRLPVISDFLDNEIETLNQKSEGLIRFANSNFISNEEQELRKKKLTANPVILEVNDLCVNYEERKLFFKKTSEKVNAVEKVTFEIRECETLGLVGESGCGKTTLGKAILQLVDVTSGEVLFMGKNLAKLSREEIRLERRNIQIVFQDPYASLNPRLTIGFAIMEPMIAHDLYSNDNQRKKKAIELLIKVGLSEADFTRYPHEFSGGQRQRICIARALSMNPKFIVFDESVSSLDVSVQAQVLNLLMQLKEDFGFACIFISHDLSVVRFVSDKILVMKDGKTEEIGFTEEICANPKSEYTKSLIDAIPKLKTDFAFLHYE